MMRYALLTVLLLLGLGTGARSEGIYGSCGCGYGCSGVVPPYVELEQAMTAFIKNVDVNCRVVRVSLPQGDTETLYLNDFTKITTANGLCLQPWDLQAGYRVTVVAAGIPENRYVLRIIVRNGW